jgi:O-antigen/teichoic acid export membrane protein
MTTVLDPAPGRTPEPALWRAVLRSGGTRLLVLPVSALLGIVVTRLVLDEWGTGAFAQYGLLVSLGALLPFADLGLSAAVVNAVAGSPDPAHDRHVHGVLVTTVRVLLGSAAVLSALVLAVAAAGAWPALLGPGLLPGSGPVAATLCFLLIALALPVGFGQRLLTGLGRNHVAVAVNGLQTPLLLAVLAVVVWTGAPAGGYVAVLAYAVTAVLAVLCTWSAARTLHPAVGRALRDVPRFRTVRGERVSDLAWPMLVQMIALPLAMQTDRIVLSHQAGPETLAEYNLAAQMFTPIWALVSAAGITLWPAYRRRRAQGLDESPARMSLAFGAAAGAVAVVIAVASPLLADVASGGRITLGWGLVGAFVLLMTLQGLKYPAGMYLTDAPGLRFQAGMVCLMLPVNLGVSWVLAGRLGAAGPVLGSALGVALFQVLANALRVRRLLRRRAADAAAARPDAPVLQEET